MPDRPLVARVVPDVSGIDKQFDYLVPDHLRDQVRVGTLVRIPLHGRRVGGWIVSLGHEPSDGTVTLDRLKPIAKVTGFGPSAELVDLVAWAAHRWAGSWRAVLRSASPPGAVRTLPVPAAAGGRASPPSAGTPDQAPAARLVDDGYGGAVQRALAAGGGVVRCPPATSVVPIIAAASALGPTLVVTPAVERARLAARRLRSVSEDVALLPDGWVAAAGGAALVVGARNAAWASVAGLAAIVVLDEHDEALQEERAPTWHARDVCLERARRAGVPCLLVSPVPSLAALAWAGDRLVVPARLDERAGWPRVEIVDRTRDDPWVTSLVTSPLIAELRDPARRVVCVLNTVGRARRLACRACRALTTCENCSAPVSETAEGILHCRRCGTERPRLCQACGSARLARLQPGVSRLREELAAAAGRPVVEVSGPRGPEEVEQAGIYVGTEAVLHRIHRADTVAFLDIDGELLAPRYRAGEQALALIARGARLAGGRDGGGRLLVQTHLPDHEVIEAIRHVDPAAAVPVLDAARAALGFPPHGALAEIHGGAVDEYAGELRRQPGLRVLGPTDGRYLVRADDAAILADGLAAVPRPAGVRIAVDPPRV